MITWKEFKEGAEAKGVKDKDEIYYIDFHGMYDVEDIFFELTEEKIRSWSIWS